MFFLKNLTNSHLNAARFPVVIYPRSIWDELFLSM